MDVNGVSACAPAIGKRGVGNAFALLIVPGVAVAALFPTLKKPILCLFGASPDTFLYADGYLIIYLQTWRMIPFALCARDTISAKMNARRPQ